MGVERRRSTLGEIASSDGYGLVDGPFGSNLPASLYTTGGVPVIRGSNLSLGTTRFRADEFVFVSDDTANRLGRSLCRPDDIVFTKKGTLGQTGLVPLHSGFDRFLLSSNQMKLTVDRSVADPLFIYYQVSSPESVAKIIRDAESTGVPKTNVAYLREFPIVLPPLSEQRAIAHILGALDDKIELNRRRNQTLEAMARALFHDWFVDFGPVRAKMEGREPYLPTDVWQLFPERLDYEGHPERWERLPIGRLLEGAIGGDWGKEQSEGDYDQAVCIIRGTDIPDLAFGFTGKVPTRFTTKKKLASRVLQEGDIVVEVSGGSPTQPTGRSLRVSSSILERFPHPVVCASFCRRFRPKNAGLGILAAYHMSNLYREGGTWMYQNQSTGISNFQTSHFLKAEGVWVPSNEILNAFVAILRPIMEKATSNESLELAQLRDTLLPKLVSGDLRIPDAERFMERAEAFVSAYGMAT